MYVHEALAHSCPQAKEAEAEAEAEAAEAEAEAAGALCNPSIWV
jgi:hypothetical protein